MTLTILSAWHLQREVRGYFARLTACEGCCGLALSAPARRPPPGPHKDSPQGAHSKACACSESDLQTLPRSRPGSVSCVQALA